MIVTPFLPAFLLLLGLALRSPRHWVIATAVACYMQGATPFLLTAGGRMVGLAPGYLLLGIGLLHDLRIRLRPRSDRWVETPGSTATAAQLWLWSFTLVGVCGAMLLPRVFEGLAHAMPTRGSLDSGLFLMVAPSSTNYFQALYLAMNLAMVMVTARFVALGEAALDDIIDGVVIGALCSAAAGVYQLIAHYGGLPWPKSFINSNIGVGQFPEQMAGPLKRITATFWEPALLSYHFVGTIGILLLGGAARLTGLLILVLQLLSTSSVGYVALMLLVMLWLLLERRAGARTMKLFLAGVLVAATFVGLDLAFNGGSVTTEMILGKASSTSGVNRGYANHLAWRTFLESWGFGVGVGSARASSFVSTLLATTGWLGLLSFGGFALTMLRGCLASVDERARALGYGLCGFFIVWCIAIPDIGQALFWFIAGAAVGHQLRSSTTRQSAVVQGSSAMGIA